MNWQRHPLKQTPRAVVRSYLHRLLISWLSSI